jgi:hypothetical protein
LEARNSQLTKTKNRIFACIIYWPFKIDYKLRRRKNAKWLTAHWTASHSAVCFIRNIGCNRPEDMYHYNHHSTNYTSTGSTLCIGYCRHIFLHATHVKLRKSKKQYTKAESDIVVLRIGQHKFHTVQKIAWSFLLFDFCFINAPRGSRDFTSQRIRT